jgi:hypothetical protein
MKDDPNDLERAHDLDRDPLAAESIGNDELERELTIAAAGPGRRRFTRFIRLLKERARRRRDR